MNPVHYEYVDAPAYMDGDTWINASIANESSTPTHHPNSTHVGTTMQPQISPALIAQITTACMQQLLNIPSTSDGRMEPTAIGQAIARSVNQSQQ